MKTSKNLFHSLMLHDNIDTSEGSHYAILRKSGLSDEEAKAKILPSPKPEKTLIILNYTDQELLRQGWATIGGRVMDFVDMLETNTRLHIYNEIKKMYDEDYDDVYRGVLAYQSMGINVYYNIDGRN